MRGLGGTVGYRVHWFLIRGIMVGYRSGVVGYRVHGWLVDG